MWGSMRSKREHGVEVGNPMEEMKGNNLRDQEYLIKEYKCIIPLEPPHPFSYLPFPTLPPGLMVYWVPDVGLCGWLMVRISRAP